MGCLTLGLIYRKLGRGRVGFGKGSCRLGIWEYIWRFLVKYTECFGNYKPKCKKMLFGMSNNRSNLNLL